jgi:nucleotide-binding universal stress UspA family protein
MSSGPLVIGYDGSAAAERALLQAAALMAPRPALVVVVWEPDRLFEAMTWPASTAGIPLAPIDIRAALELQQKEAERVQELAARAADRAREAGLEAEGLAVADDRTVADTLIRLVRDQDGRALVIGARPHGAIGELVLGSTEREVLRKAPCPVLVVRDTGQDG